MLGLLEDNPRKGYWFTKSCLPWIFANSHMMMIMMMIWIFHHNDIFSPLNRRYFPSNGLPSLFLPDRSFYALYEMKASVRYLSLKKFLLLDVAIHLRLKSPNPNKRIERTFAIGRTTTLTIYSYKLQISSSDGCLITSFFNNFAGSGNHNC